jgi:uncharacterized membrane protein YhhN
MDRFRQLAWWAFIAASTVHLVAQLTSTGGLQTATKPLLMPLLLAWFLLATPPGRLRTIVGIGLFWSWLGDLGLMPSGQGWFLVGLGAFLVAQLTYSVAFWPFRDRSVVRRPALAAPYLVVLVGLLVVLWDHLGDLRLPVIAYAVVIITMAMLATGLGRIVATGAALFVLSDALIAVNSVAGILRLPAHGFWVMLTYLAAQALIAQGVQRVALQPTADAADRSAASGP